MPRERKQLGGRASGANQVAQVAADVKGQTSLLRLPCPQRQLPSLEFLPSEEHENIHIPSLTHKKHW